MLHKRKDKVDRIDIDKKYLITKEKILRNKMKILFLAWETGRERDRDRERLRVNFIQRYGRALNGEERRQKRKRERERARVWESGCKRESEYEQKRERYYEYDCLKSISGRFEPATPA